MKQLLVLLVALCAVPAFANDFYYERYWTGCGYGYRKVYYPAQTYAPPVAVTPNTPAVQQQTKKETTIINNLIGIPVPVQYTQPIAQQGTTVYGYSAVAEAYGNVDLGLLYNQAARLTDQAQQLAGQAATDFQALVVAEGQNRAEVAKIVAQGQAARDALLAAKGAPAASTQRAFSFRVVQDSRGEMKVEQITGNNNGTPDFNLTQKVTDGGNISEILKARCLSCHSDTKTSGGLNFLKPITDVQQKACLDRITTKDPKLRMPPNANLTVEEIAAFFTAMGTSK